MSSDLTAAHSVAAIQAVVHPHLDVRQWTLFAIGFAVAAIVLPPLHLGLFLLNGLFGFWLARQPWDWVRRYGAFFLLETIYFFAKVTFPRPYPSQTALIAPFFPAGPYFLFLWFAVEVVLYMKLLDYVLSAATERRPRLPEFLFFLFYPFTFFNGPVLGFDEFRRSYRPSLGAEDVFYGVRKCSWGALQLFVLAIWLQGAVLGLRSAVLQRAPLTQMIDSRLLMWAWIAGMSILMSFVLKGYTDLMVGCSRLAGYRFPEQFWFNLFAKDPVEYWQNSNRWVYRITSQHIFNRFFDRRRIGPKILLATMASGTLHALVCPQPSLAIGLLLAGLLGITGVAVLLTYRLRSIGQTRFVQWINEGPGRNALVVAGVVFTFALMAVPRSAFLLMVEGVTVRDWFGLVRLLFVRI